MTKDKTGPAFPQPITSTIDGHTLTTCHFDNAQSGITMRDYFAGRALQGLLSNGNKDVVRAFSKYPETADEQFAESAYHFGDAMMKIRDIEI